MIANNITRSRFYQPTYNDCCDYAQDVEKPKRILEVEEIEALLDACSNVKWRLFCYLAIALGLRLSEITNLLWKDVDLEKGLVHVQNHQDWKTKGKRKRTVGLSRKTRPRTEIVTLW